jgi:putative tryptophan/tyrosine transport system substrate-binding protein
MRRRKNSSPACGGGAGQSDGRGGKFSPLVQALSPQGPSLPSPTSVRRFIRRREFIALVGAAGAVTSLRVPVVHAQQTAGKPLIGVLMAGLESAPDNQQRLAAFRQGLADLGWRENDNIRIEYRWSAGKEDLIRKYAEELVALAPNVIVANSTPVISEFKSIGTTIPVAFALDIDPVGLGHVKSLSHPGGNFTGFTFINPELIGKWMELLRSMSPGIRTAAVLFNPDTTPPYDKWVNEIASARSAGAIEVVAMHARTSGEIEAGFKSLTQNPGTGLMIGPDPFNQVHIKEIAQLAGQYRLPAVSVYRPFVAEGGLMAYGPDTANIFRQSAAYVDRILKGEKPADLPVQQPTKFEFIINLKAAKTLGIDVPPTLLALADEVIE